MFLPLLIATVLSAEPVSPPPTPPPLVPTEAAAPIDAPAEQPPLIQQKPRAPRSPKRGLTVAGVAVFGGAWALSLAVAGISELAARSVPSFPPQTSPFTALFVPVVGPLIALADVRNLRSATTVGFLVLDALVQAGGLTLLIIGIAMPEAQPAKPTVWLTPTLSPNGAGAALGGTF